jgi:hypothetical protein
MGYHTEKMAEKMAEKMEGEWRDHEDLETRKRCE